MGLSTLLRRIRGLGRRADVLTRVWLPARVASAALDADTLLVRLRRAVARAPEDPRAGLALANGLERAGRLEDAARMACSAAHLARHCGDAQTELEACQVWARLEPTRPEPAIALAAALAAAGQAAPAAEAYEAVIATHGARVDLLLALGAVHDEMARSDDAYLAYARAVELEFENVDALIHAGVCARNAGRHAEGEALLERALRIAPDAAPAIVNLGLLRTDRGGPDTAAHGVEAARAPRRGKPRTDAVPGQRLKTRARDTGRGRKRARPEHDIDSLGCLQAAGRIGSG